SPEQVRHKVRGVQRLPGRGVPLISPGSHADGKMRENPRTPPATLKTARNIAREIGLVYVFTGNIHDPAGQSTYCQECNELLIGRDWYELTAWNLDAEGRCSRCGTACAGVFEGAPGTWGTRRQMVRVAPTEMRLPA